MRKMQLILGALLVLSASRSVADQCLAKLSYVANDGATADTADYWLVDCGHAACGGNVGNIIELNQSEASKFHRRELNRTLETFIAGGYPDVVKDQVTDELLVKLSNTRTNKYVRFCVRLKSNEALDRIVGN